MNPAIAEMIFEQYGNDEKDELVINWCITKKKMTKAQAISYANDIENDAATEDYTSFFKWLSKFFKEAGITE